MLPPKNQLLARVKGNRTGWDPDFRPATLEPADGPNEESVWDYPRPPVLVPAPATITVKHHDVIIARSDRALELKETAGAPVPYIPPEDIERGRLVANGRLSICEWKGAALSLDLVLDDGARLADVGWTYPDPFDDLPEGYAAIAGWSAFYPAKLDCFVGDEKARPQPCGFYGGWVTDRIKGPIKGEPGSGHW